MATSQQLLHLALADDWAAAQHDGYYRTSTLGRTLADEGFIHLSFPHQIAGVAAAFYTGVTDDLVLLEIDTAAVAPDLVVEPGSAGPGAELFPHLYGPLPTTAVLSVRPAHMVDGRLRTT